MAYVDLNPIRAGLTQSLQDSPHTSVARRLREASITPTKLSMAMQPVAGPASSALSRLSLAAYVDLVDWTGRQIRPDKRGHITAQIPHALAQIAHSDERWLLEVRAIGSGYWRAVGCVHSLLERAAAMGQRWLKGVGMARTLESI